jgi:hypothetical protein
MDKFEVTMTAVLLDVLDQAGVLGEVVDKAVNGTDEISLGFHDETDVDRAIVCAAFQVLGQEVADHAHPIAAVMIVAKLVEVRDATIQIMKDIPR